MLFIFFSCDKKNVIILSTQTPNTPKYKNK